MASVDELIAGAKEKMVKSVEHARSEFGTVRTGRASASLLDRIEIDYYGTATPLRQLATINVPEPRLLTIPELTEERRKELVRIVRGIAEDGRVAVRNVRRNARKDLEALEKDGDISSDELERAEKELEKVTHTFVEEIDHMLQTKEQELLSV